MTTCRSGFSGVGCDGKPVTDTLFQAGSISKPLAAMAALRLVQAGKLSLDADINGSLPSWHLPPSPAAPDATVTLRELLSHTAGIKVHGFRGYTAGSPVPTLVQVLDGTKPANTSPIRIAKVSGTEWNYSGGGFVVMQQALVDTTHEPFPKLMAGTVWGRSAWHTAPMSSRYPYPWRSMQPLLTQEMACPCMEGTHLSGDGCRRLVDHTPSDLAKYTLEVQGSLSEKANHVLDSAMTTMMLTPGKNHWGLGIDLGGNDANPYFTQGRH